MARNLKDILVVDLECTCWDGQPPQGQQQEIIEIGIAVVNAKSGAVIDAESIIVRPTASQVSPFCTELTSITPVMVDNGILFVEACAALRRDFDSTNITWASWGDFDRRMFQRQCGKATWDNVQYPFGPTHLNVKNLFALQYKLQREVGMSEALNQLGMQLEGTHHRGVDDARNIARILRVLLGS